MKSVICTITLVLGAIAPAAFGDVSPGSEPRSSSDGMIERWTDRATRNQISSPEAGFANMLARRDELPTRSLVRGEPNPVALKIAAALQAQRASGWVNSGPRTPGGARSTRY